jgi:hypothetical protein
VNFIGSRRDGGKSGMMIQQWEYQIVEVLFMAITMRNLKPGCTENATVNGFLKLMEQRYTRERNAILSCTATASP